MVPGVYGTWDDNAGGGPGSRTSKWVTRFAEEAGPESRILRFQYSSHHLFSGRQSREAIRNCALKLLRSLSSLRKEASRVRFPRRAVSLGRLETNCLPKKRMIMFVTYDLGGIIVKDVCGCDIQCI